MFGGERGDGAGRWGEGEREIMGRPVWGRGGGGVRADVGAGSTGGRGYDLYSVAIFKALPETRFRAPQLPEF